MVIKTVREKILSLFNKEDERSRKVLINTLFSFGVKGGSILVGLLLVPMTINYINPIQYGIWLTISSIVGWMSFFDVGMGHGLRNHLAECLAHEKYEDAKIYISTTYAVLSIISAILFGAVVLVNPFIDWRSFLNIPASVLVDIHLVVLLVFCSFCVQFVVQLINTILLAVHESAKSAFIAFLGQLSILIAIVIIKRFVEGSLSNLVLILTGTPVFVLLIASTFIFRTKLKNIAPSFKSIDFSYAKKVLGIGGVFFIIQIGAMVLFQTDNIIITRVIGPQAVTQFNVSYKLFSVITMIFSIIVTPYWSAFTDAYAKEDFKWIKKSIAQIRKVVLLLSAIAVLVCIFSSLIFKLWLGDTVSISITLSVAMTVYAIIFMWQTAHVFLLNGIGKIRLQLILVLLSAIVNIPIAVFLGKTWGLAGIISANTLVFLIMSVFFYIQVEKIINHKAQGIWNK